MVHSVQFTTQILFSKFPTTDIMEADTFTIEFYATLLLNCSTHLLFVKPFFQCRNSSPFSDQIHIFINIIIRRRQIFIQCLGISQISISHPIQDTGLISIFLINRRYIQRNTLSYIITILRGIKGHICIQTTLQKVHIPIGNP